jgi:hypothetical protein
LHTIDFTIPTIAGIVSAFAANHNILFTMMAICYVIFSGAHTLYHAGVGREPTLPCHVAKPRFDTL